MRLKKYTFQTATTPYFPDGTVRVSSRELTYGAQNILDFTLKIDDPKTFLSDFELVIHDHENEILVSEVVFSENISVDISSLKRGYITLTLKARSTHETSTNQVKTYLTYKIFY